MTDDTRLIPLTRDEVARLQLIREHEGNDLSPNDEGLLRSIASRYEDSEAFTAQDFRDLDGHLRVDARARIGRNPETWPPWAKLAAAFTERNPR